MTINVRVPLIWPVHAVIYRLDIQATWGVDPPGDQDQGFDPILREPIVYRTASGVRASTRTEMPPVKVRAQVEYKTVEELRMAATGDDPLTRNVFVVHRQDLEGQNLIDTQTGNCKLKPGDRISHLEKVTSAVKIREWKKPLYVYRVDDGSQGFGDGYDLHIIWTTHRDMSARSSQEL